MSDKIKTQSLVLRFLKETEPAKLLLWCAVFVVLAGLCGIASLQVISGWNLNASYEQWQSSSYRIMDYSSDPNRASFVRRALPVLLNLGAFGFGTIAALLPMWTVGRLIADAIRDGAKS